jgi:3-methyladenine DNA glycosylase Tag
MKEKMFSVKDVQKMVKTTMKRNDWNNSEFASYAETTSAELCRFMKAKEPKFAPAKIVKAFGLQKIVTVKYINEGE